MAVKKRKREQFTFDLFPFFSVLVCSIGTLVLIIMASSIASIVRSDKVVLLELVGKETGTTLEPVYIECLEDRVVIQPQKIVVSTDDMDSPGSPLVETIRNVGQNMSQRYALLAVRPEGVATFYRVRAMIETAGIEHAYEAVNTEWKLQF